MEQLTDILNRINVPTKELETSSIQNILQVKQYEQCKCSTNERQPCDCRRIWYSITAKLYEHLLEGLVQFDDQLLCATAFYTALNVTDKINKQCYLDKVLQTVENELAHKKSGSTKTSETARAVSLMYGIFQSQFLTPTTLKMRLELHSLNFEPVLDTMTELLFLMAYDYSKFTYIVFKTMASFEKIRKYAWVEVVFNHANIETMLNVIIHNWENPITGIRDLNRKMYGDLVSIRNDAGLHTHKLLNKLNHMLCLSISEVRNFSSNKAKCLILAEHMKANLEGTTHRDFVCSTLSKPGLVAAGADYYYAILEKTKDHSKWCDLFLQKVVDIFNGTSEKAIENFTDYWCLPTLKKYPILADELIKTLGDLDTSERKLFGGLSLLKQANKLRLVKKNWCSVVANGNSIEKYVLSALDHCNTKIRMMAFEIICVSHSKGMPTKLEYDLVSNYLRNNINSDCRVLRINMLKSLTNFLVNLLGSYLSTIKNKQEYNEGDLLHFCAEYQELIVTSLNMNGNYQRKITCIELVDAFLTSLGQIQKKRQGPKQQELSIVLTLKESDQLKFLEHSFMKTLLTLTDDAAADIRENAANLLLKYYTDQLTDTVVFNELIDRALRCLSSKFFYDISCGHIKFNLVLKLLVACKVSGAAYKSVEDIFSYGFKSLISEYESRRGVVESIEEGKQLHSYITLLHDVFQVCLENKHLIAVSSDQFKQLLTVLEGVSNQFAWEQDDTSSDFSKMNDMVQDLIRESGSTVVVDADETKLSSLHQIVLNCLWLNVKASCELASIVIQYQKWDADSDVCERALRVISRVLETCRHKGAIEAAGVALGKSIRHLTALSNKHPLSGLPHSLLQTKLQELIQTNSMASVTRRGAGLSIMLHRIVASDSRKDKPLFQHFMTTVLEACNDSKAAHTQELLDTEKDIPKAVYIHFLTRIVTDSSLTCDVLYYSDKLAELAFGNLTSPHWQIRNAALQLYGALLPKLIGQKKSSSDDEPTATVACDELRTHLPKLWQHMMDTLNDQSQASNQNEMEHHSNLVPILNVLASCGKRYNYSTDLKIQKDADSKLFESLKRLLQSPIYTVRKLSVKAIYNIYHDDELMKWLINILLKVSKSNQNALNGLLMLMEIHVKDYYITNNGLNMESASKYRIDYNIFSNLVNGKDDYHYDADLVRNYVNKLQFLNAFPIPIIDEIRVADTLAEVQGHFFAPGVNAWAKRCLELGLSASSWEVMPELMKMVLDLISVNHGGPIGTTIDLSPYQFQFKGHDSEQYCEIIFTKLEQTKDVPKQVLLEMAEILQNTYKTIKSSITWKFLYEISKRVDPKEIKTEGVITFLTNGSEIFYAIRYLVPYAARVVPHTGNQKAISRLSDIIFSSTDLKTSDYDMRYIAALAVIELAKQFLVLSEETKVVTLTSAIVLLQDEDEDIRNVTVEFYKHLITANRAPHPYICITKLLDHNFLSTILSVKGIENLCRLLTNLFNDLATSKNEDKYNPFANEFSNIYMETEVMMKLIEKVRSNMTN